MLSHVEELLRCPHCGAAMTVGCGWLACRTGHRFDIARQGYANLAVSQRHRRGADTVDMVTAREAFLSAGHYAAVTSTVVGAAVRAAGGPAGAVVDLGAGTGHHLAAVLEAMPGWVGLAADLSVYAARRAARAHERVAAVVCDIWDHLPVASGRVDVVLDVFAPRNVAEITRILRPDGALVLVTPAGDHLGELVERMDLVHVDPAKQERIADAFGGVLDVVQHRRVRHRMVLRRADVAALVRMGPSAHHVDDADLQRSLADLEEPVDVTASVDVRVLRAV